MIATGIGSMPGEAQADFDEAVRVVLGELPDLPYLPEIPGRGATASMTGRALAVVAELAADLQPAGWRLTSGAAPGVDHRRARSLLAQDLDTMEEQAEGLTGAFKVQVAGPWTLAATVEKPRGDKILSDHGARRDLAQALAAGVVDHLHDVRRRLPGLERLVVQVDEPALAAVGAGAIPTASGFGRHRVVHPPEISEHLGWVLGAIAETGATPVVHSCAAEVPIDLIRSSGAGGVSLDVGAVDAATIEALAGSMEAGDLTLLGLVPALDPADLSDRATAERAQRLLDLVGIDPSDQLVITPTCGLAGSSRAWARQALRQARSVAAAVSSG